VPLEGFDVLAEHRSELGLLLWHSCRDVALWGAANSPADALFAAAAAERRAGLLRRVEVEAELQGPLAVFAALLGGKGAVDVPRLVHACRRVARWAEGQGKLGTAVEFLHAAVSAAPTDASLAVQIGRLSRMRAQYDKAELWFRDAVARARQQRDWQAYAEGAAGLGNLYVQKGNFPQARRFHRKCLRAALRHGLREMQGAAWHNLFGIAVECGETERAAGYAARALRAYPPGSAGLPRLSLDLSYHWIVQGHFGAALSLLRATLPHIAHPGVRATALANLARAAGGAGDAEGFERAWSQVWAMVEGGSAEDGAARALLDLAHGATALARWGHARRAAEAALETARRRDEGKVALEAESVLETVRTRVPPRPRPAPDAANASTLAGRFALALRHG
jgi:tetratricopeptide (TPR) repeat protein